MTNELRSTVSEQTEFLVQAETLTSARTEQNIRIKLRLCFDEKKLKAAKTQLFKFLIHHPNSALVYYDHMVYIHIVKEL